ncbi:hypothetical protein [Roseovarius aestuariivivens]|uniref:hypothetical protein n=1 Tax=Roseovarius aestuariivivens TaxID=1888910 RepID=UPI00108229F6|nr:hypothetical protein [Roseovarius aestuariivivens]
MTALDHESLLRPNLSNQICLRTEIIDLPAVAGSQVSRNSDTTAEKMRKILPKIVALGACANFTPW